MYQFKMNQNLFSMSYLFKHIFIKISTHITGNKNIKFPHINQLWRLALENFFGISQGQVLVTDSLEALQN